MDPLITKLIREPLQCKITFGYVVGQNWSRRNEIPTLKSSLERGWDYYLSIQQKGTFANNFTKWVVTTCQEFVVGEHPSFKNMIESLGTKVVIPDHRKCREFAIEKKSSID